MGEKTKFIHIGLWKLTREVDHKSRQNLEFIYPFNGKRTGEEKSLKGKKNEF